MLDQELSQQQAAGGVGLVTDESRQKQLLQEDEEEDFLDEGRKNSLLLQGQDLTSFISVVLDGAFPFLYDDHKKFLASPEPSLSVRLPRGGEGKKEKLLYIVVSITAARIHPDQTPLISFTGHRRAKQSERK